MLTLRRRGQHPPKKNLPMRILETALYALNLEETAQFYESVLGLQRHSEVAGRFVFFNLETHMFLLFNPEASQVPEAGEDLPIPPHGATGPGHICFELKPGKAQAWRERLDAHGIEIEADFIWPDTQARSIYFRDPAGNSVELGEAKIWF